MSIRLRFTLLYNVILALTLAVFGIVLYTIQARTTLDALKKDLLRSSESLGMVILREETSRPASPSMPTRSVPPPVPFESFSDDQAFNKIPEREIVRVLDASGNLVASPFGLSEDSLPLSDEGLLAAQAGQTWWETSTFSDQKMLIYTRPLIVDGQISYILQIARPLTERNRSLQSLSTTLVIASLATILIAFGIGWVLSGITLRPIDRITQTALAIGEERDFTRRVAYTGPPDEVGRLAHTFNDMLARLQEAYQRVNTSLKMQRDFVLDVSHELRTPLTTIRGNLALLNRKTPLPKDEQADVLTDLVSESDRLIRLVNELLVLARADAGFSLKQEHLQVRPVIDAACRQIRQLDEMREIVVQAEEDASVLCDRDAFKQVILILLDNALKYSTGTITICAIEEAGTTRLQVSDQGPGIPPERLEHVFDRFFRGEEQPKVEGMGLGLAIAKALVEAQKGTIEIKSEVGVGTELVVKLPRE